MSLKVQYTFNHGGIVWRSGHFYSFRYTSWINDPKPLIILLYKVSGIHPNTGHQHRYIQACNISYLPRSHRRIFVNQWMYYFNQNNGNVRFTYEDLKRRYPYLRYSIRRYFTSPAYYIVNPIEIDPDNVEEATMSIYNKDFSKKVAQELTSKYNRVMQNTKEIKKKTNKGLFGGIFKNIFKWMNRS